MGRAAPRTGPSPQRPHLTWQELDRQADEAASLLLELGVQPGDVVAWQLPNWHEFVVLTLAAPASARCAAR